MELEHKSAIVGAIVGAILTAIFAGALWYGGVCYQEAKERHEIAQALYSDISSLNASLVMYANAYREQEMGDQASMTERLLNQPLVSEVQPIYPPESLYHIYKKDITKLDSDLSESIFTFYNDLIGAENDRIYFVSLRESGKTDFNTNFTMYLIYIDIKQRVIRAEENMQSLKDRLRAI